MSPTTKHALSEFKLTTELAKGPHPGLPSLQIDGSPPMRSQYWNQLRHHHFQKRRVKSESKIKKKRRRRIENDYIKIEKS